MSQVFISYRHSPHGHSDRVKNLMHTLRQAGVNILCDQQLTGGPDEGWTMWSQQQVERADKVLIACTAGWAECYEANQPLPAGLGSVAEVLPLDKTHGEINAQLGADPAYTASVEHFLERLSPAFASK